MSNTDIQSTTRIKPTPEPIHTTKPTPEPIHTTKPIPEPAHTTKPTPEPAHTTKPTPEPLPALVEDTEGQLTNDENIAGRLVIALTKTSDIYLSRKKDHFSIEYSAGRVDFTVKNRRVDILQTKRISDEVLFLYSVLCK
ncbi:MAG: hypothetical protein ACW964_20070 [Candidatus Hodarchaeales archaeon]|jgi:hypothetical protein